MKWRFLKCSQVVPIASDRKVLTSRRITLGEERSHGGLAMIFFAKDLGCRKEKKSAFGSVAPAELHRF